MPLATLKMLTLDSADAERDGRFWSEVLGWEVAHSGNGYAMLTDPEGSGAALGFGTVEGYQPPGWPNEAGSKQFHLDLAVEDLDESAASLVSLGATKPDEQPGEGRWVVLLDPSGHPFCLTQAGNW